MNFIQIIKTIVLLSFVSIIFSCGSNGSSNVDDGKSKKDTIKEETSAVTNDASKETFYLIPSPEELFRFIQDGNLRFSEKFLNSKNNVNNYISRRSKELNFGIYAADLAYVASFNKYQQSIDYLEVVRKLSDEIGIASVFDEHLMTRIDKITDNKDSLLRVTNDTYIDIVTYLDGIDRQESLAQIVTGGWIESIYVVVNLLDSYKENPQIVSLLASQKVVIANLVMYLKKRQNDKNIQATIADLEPIAKFYESLESKPQAASKSQEKAKKDGKIVVGGNNEIVMSEKQFGILKTEISKLRNNITQQ